MIICMEIYDLINMILFKGIQIQGKCSSIDQEGVIVRIYEFDEEWKRGFGFKKYLVFNNFSYSLVMYI